MNGSYFVPTQLSSDFDFFQALRGYVRFSLFVLFIFTLLAVLLWNMQPWFEIEIKPVSKAKEGTTASAAQKNPDKALQSAVETISYVVRPGDTLSEIAERYGVGLSTLLKHNGLADPNALRAGQRLRIPQRRSE